MFGLVCCMRLQAAHLQRTVANVVSRSGPVSQNSAGQSPIADEYGHPGTQRGYRTVSYFLV
jgi:hypothetical protein